jgi:hypothetical protein
VPNPNWSLFLSAEISLGLAFAAGLVSFCSPPESPDATRNGCVRDASARYGFPYFSVVRELGGRSGVDHAGVVSDQMNRELTRP